MMVQQPEIPAGQVGRKSDLIGILNSSVCVVHCISLPVLVSLGATFVLHPAVTWAFILVALISVFLASRHAHRTWIRVVLWTALVLFTVSIVLEERHIVFEALSYFASALLIVGHVLNRRYCRTCSH